MGNKGCSACNYPKSSFLTVLKPHEAWGFFFAEEKHLFRAGWILENSGGGGRGPILKP